MVPVFIGITVVSFFMMHLAPGTPTDLITDLNVKVSLSAREQLVKLYGLDRPLAQQYFSWAGRIIRGDFGRSFRDGQPVMVDATARQAIIPIKKCSNSQARCSSRRYR